MSATIDPTGKEFKPMLTQYDQDKVAGGPRRSRRLELQAELAQLITHQKETEFSLEAGGPEKANYAVPRLEAVEKTVRTPEAAEPHCCRRQC